MADDESEAPAKAEGANASDAPKLITPRDRVMAVVRAVADRHGLLVSDLLMGAREPGARRHDRARARQEAMVEVGEAFPNMSTPQIGAFFGGRDHTTVLFARDAVKRRRAAEARRAK